MTLLDLLADYTTTTADYMNAPKDWNRTFAYHDTEDNFLFVKPGAFKQAPFLAEGLQGFLDSDQLIGHRTVCFHYTAPPIRAYVFDLMRQDRRLDFGVSHGETAGLKFDEEAQERSRNLYKLRKSAPNYVPRKRNLHLLPLIKKNEFRMVLNLHYRDIVRIAGTNRSECIECVDGSGLPGDTYVPPHKSGVSDPIGMIYRRNGPGWNGVDLHYVMVNTVILQEWADELRAENHSFDWKEDTRYSHTEKRTIGGLTMNVAVFDMNAHNEPLRKGREPKTPNQNRATRKARREALQREREERLARGEIMDVKTLESFLMLNKHRRGKVCRQDGDLLYIIVKEIRQTSFEYRKDPRFVGCDVKYFKPWLGLNEMAVGSFYCAVFRIE